MKVTLINPKLKTWSPNVYPPLGLCYIAAALEDSGHEVEIIDCNSKKIHDSDLIRKCWKSDITGITGMVTEYQEVVRLSRMLKNANRDRMIVLGGPLATTHTEEVLRDSGADIAVIGEGEVTIVELVDKLSRKGEFWFDTLGIAVNYGEEVAINGVRESVIDLDTLGFPARHLLDLNRYSTHHFKSFGLKTKDIKSTTLISSRGCSFNCTFCDASVNGRKWRARSAENVLEEIVDLYNRYGFKGFIFQDDTFVINRKRVVQFCKLLIDAKTVGWLPEDASWYCNGRVNLMDEELLNLMALSGCTGVAYGVESGNQDILDSIKKGITLEQLENITALTKKAGMQVTGYFMVGILGDTKETIQQTFNFAEKLDLDFYGFTMTSPIPGTVMHDQAKELGLVGDDKLQDWSFNACMNLTKDCSTEELEEFNRYAFKKFTIEKRYGNSYLLNYKLWLDGFKSLIFLLGKRDVSVLLKKVKEVVN